MSSPSGWVMVAASTTEALADVASGQTILAGGFGDSGYPLALLTALIAAGHDRLHVVSNNAGRADYGIGELIRQKRIRKLTSTYPVAPGNQSLQAVLQQQDVEVELVAQGTLAQRLHAGSSGLGGILTPVGVHGDIPMGEGTSLIDVDGRTYRLERPLRGDIALIAAEVADRYGNLRFHRVARNFNPVMAAAADRTIAEVARISETPLDPDDVHVPGIYVDVLTEVPPRRSR